MSTANLLIGWLVFLHLLPLQGNCMVISFSEGLVTAVFPVVTNVVPSPLIFARNMALLWSSRAWLRQGIWRRKGDTVLALYIWGVWFGTVAGRRDGGGLLWGAEILGDSNNYNIRELLFLKLFHLTLIPTVRRKKSKFPQRNLKSRAGRWVSDITYPVSDEADSRTQTLCPGIS